MSAKRLPLRVRAYYQSHHKRLHNDSAESVFTVATHKENGAELNGAGSDVRNLKEQQYESFSDYYLREESRDSISLSIHRNRPNVIQYYYCANGTSSWFGKCFIVTLQISIALAVFIAIATLIATHHQPPNTNISIDVHTTIDCEPPCIHRHAASVNKDTVILPENISKRDVTTLRPQQTNSNTFSTQVPVIVPQSVTVIPCTPDTNNSTSLPDALPTQCIELLGIVKTGFHQLLINGVNKTVYCDMDTDGGGWTSIQRRTDGSTRFDRDWEHYRNGFGDQFQDYWIGLDSIHYLTSKLGITQTLMVELKSCAPEINETTKACAKTSLDSTTFEFAQATYTVFKVDDETKNYAQHVTGWSGCLPDMLGGDEAQQEHGIPFSTPDRNNARTKINLAERMNSGWWISRMPRANPNGSFRSDCKGGPINGMFWHEWKTMFATARTVEMKIRQAQPGELLK